MRISPKDINLDALERKVIFNALNALIAKEQARIARLSSLKYRVNPVNIELAENTISQATDLLVLFKN